MTSSVIRDSFRLANLKKFMTSLSDYSVGNPAKETLYIGIGRPQYWDVATVPNNDAVELESALYSAKNTLASEKFDREDLMSLKKVNPSDISHGILKEVWTAGKKYDTYRHDWDGTIQSVYDNSFPASLSSVKYVVINNAYDVYICIKQGKTGSVVNPSIYSPETGVPVGTNTGVLKTADGYYWKFMSKTDGSDIATFTSITHHPVKTLKTAPTNTSVYYTQWTSQLNSQNFKSGIYVINITNGGSGYNGGSAGIRVVTDAENDAQFRVIGDGTGMQYSVSYGSGGSINDIEITNPGTGYTHAVIQAIDGAGATFDIIYTPSTGLGADPVKDTSALYFLCSISLQSDEGGKFTVKNDYRKVYLVSNPFNYGTSVISTASTLSAYFTFTLDTIVGGSNAFKADDIITGSSSGAKARVIDFDGVNKLRVIRTSTENLGLVGANNNFLVGETLSTTGGAGTGVISIITLPDMDKSSGEIIYSEYRGAILRQPGQTEVVKCIVEF
jgi:hypothetical protein